MVTPTFAEEVPSENVGADIIRPAGNVAFTWRFPANSQPVRGRPMVAPTFTEEVPSENVGADIIRPAGNVAFTWRFRRIRSLYAGDR